MIGPKEAAKILGVSSQTVRLWMLQEKIPYVKVGSRYRISEDVIKGILTPHYAKTEPTN